MKDDFFSQFHRPPRPQFAAALYQRINQSMTTDTQSPAALRRSFFHGDKPPLLLRGAVLGVLILFVILTVTVACVPSVRAAVIETLQEMWLGPNTSVAQVAPGAGREPRPLPKDMWVIRTEIGGFGGNTAPGVEPIVRSVSRLEEAQALTNYPLKVPAELPAGYALQEVKVAPMGTTVWAILFYHGPGHDLIIAEMPGGPQPSQDPNVAVAIKNGALTDGSLEAVDLDGRPAVWINGHTLLWEADGVSLEVGGLDLDLAQAKTLAQSLR